MSEQGDRMGVIARDLAVEIVDMVHGFTVDFSNQPSAHLAEYDTAEKIIGRALADLHQGAVGAVERYEAAIRQHREAVMREFRAETPIKADAELWAMLPSKPTTTGGG